MEKRVIFRDRQELQAADLTNLGEFTKTALDHIVKDGIQDQSGWVEFSIVKTGTAEVTVKPGRIYTGGQVYVSESDIVFDLLSELPAVNKKWVAIVAWGSEVETDTQPRDFLIDATTGATEPQAVPMQRLRRANINTIVGIEAAQPTKPLVPSGNVLLGWVLLNPTDVESISIENKTKLPQVARNALRLDELEEWRAIIGARVDSLAAEIAKLWEAIKQAGGKHLLQSLAIDVALLKEFTELEEGHSDYDADRFLDDLESEVEDVNFLARVEEGCRFSNEAENETSIQLFNPINPDVSISSQGVLIPKYNEVKRFHVGPFNEELSISQYQFATHDCVQKTISRKRIRYGETLTVCTNVSWWRTGRYDPVTNIFHKDGQTWEVIGGNPRAGHSHVRLRRFWYDEYEETYWEHIVNKYTVDGQQIGQTFLNAQDGWITSIGLYFTRKGGTGNVDVLLTEVDDNGIPNVKKTIQRVTLNVEDIQVSADGTVETKVPIPHTFVSAGERYAIVLITGGDHYVAMALGTQYAQGTFFYTVDGAYQQGTFNKDMMFSLYYAEFERTRYVVDLQAMSLSGGITDIDIMAPMVIPQSCSLIFEVQVNGVWRPLEEVTSGNTVLFGLPPLLPFRAVFNGTTTVQPGLGLVDSVLRYFRPRTTFKHISVDYNLRSPADTIKVVCLLENYYEDNHDFDCVIRIDGGGQESEIAADAVIDRELEPPIDARSPDHKKIERTFVFESLGGAESVRIVMNGSTTSALDTFHVGWRVHLAFPGAE